MPAQHLPLRLLNSSVVCFAPIKMASHSSSSSIFSRVFPFRLRNHSSLHSATRTYSSSRSFRGNGDNSRRSPEMSRSQSQRRGEFRPESLSAGGRAAKSLIEDEAELSDWVSELKTDSIHLNWSESDDAGLDEVRDVGRDRRRGADASSSSLKRQRGSESDRFAVGNSRRDPRPMGTFSKGPRPLDSDSDEDSDEKEKFPPRRGRGDFVPRGGVSFKRGGRDSDFRYGRGRVGEDTKRSPYVSGRQRLQASDSGNSEEEKFPLRERGRGQFVTRGGGVSSKKGGKDSGLRYGRGIVGGDSTNNGKALGGRKLQIFDSDEDEEDEDDLSGLEDSEEEESEDEGLPSNSGPKLVKEDSKQLPIKSSSTKSDSYLSETRFDQCSISPLSLKGIQAAGYERMTMVQEATLPVILKGKDVLAKAKTGTGKTVAFLLPSIEVIAKLPPPDRDNKRPPINVLVICPTRELANQAATEANALLKFHPSIGVQVVIGGTRLALEQKRMQANPCQILVATPGRLRDHIENTPSFATRLMGVKVLVLDEADHLLDMGFRKDIEKVIAAVPKQRQTLLFSATVPEEVRQISHIALKRDHEFISTVEEGSEETHTQVKQMHLVAPLDKHFPMLYSILKEHISEDVDFKVLVFCTTAMVTRFVADLLAELKLNVREIHSRKPQSYRTRVSDEFRKSKGLILVTSDVSARGVDYPDVTLVIQMGIPSGREQYIHRLGRTGRKGKEGEGILLLAPWEDFFLSSVKDLPITRAPLPFDDSDIRKKVDQALSHVEMKNKEAAYQAWLGYYNSNKNISRDKCRLVQLANEFSKSMGLDNPPAIPKLVIGKMGLKNVPGLRIK